MIEQHTWKHNYFEIIEARLIKSAINSYEENLRYSYQRTDFKSRMIEYLIVVNIAKNLFDWAWHELIHVQLEYPLSYFYNGAFPEISLRSKLKRKNHNPKNNISGRIDIALTKEPFRDFAYRNPKQKSLVGIEVKSFIKKTGDVEKDISRLSKAMLTTDTIGENSIQACYCLFFRKLDSPTEIIKDDKIPIMKSKEISRWETILDKFREQFSTLSFVLHPIEVKEAALAQLSKKYDPLFFDIDDLCKNEVAENSGLIMSYLVKLKRNQDAR